jgi:hypothetical protein
MWCSVLRGTKRMQLKTAASNERNAPQRPMWCGVRIPPYALYGSMQGVAGCGCGSMYRPLFFPTRTVGGKEQRRAKRFAAQPALSPLNKKNPNLPLLGTSNSSNKKRNLKKATAHASHQTNLPPPKEFHARRQTRKTQRNYRSATLSLQEPRIH